MYWFITQSVGDVHLVEVSNKISSKATEIQEASDIIKLAEKVRESHDFVKSRALGRLSTIAQQMKLLRMVGCTAFHFMKDSKFPPHFHSKKEAKALLCSPVDSIILLRHRSAGWDVDDSFSQGLLEK